MRIMQKSIKEMICDFQDCKLDFLAETYHSNTEKLFEIFREKRNFVVQIQDLFKIELLELLCYTGKIADLGLFVPPIEPVLSFYNENLTEYLPKLIGLEKFPAWVYRLDSCRKIEIINFFSVYLDGKLQNTFESSNFVQNLENIENIKNETVYAENFSELSTISINSEDIVIDQNDINHTGENQKFDLFDEHKNVRGNLRSLILSLDNLELNSVLLNSHTEDIFIERFNDKSNIFKLFTIRNIFAHKILKKTNFQSFKREIRIYCASQSIPNINIQIFKLFFLMKIDAINQIYKEIISIVCYDCLSFYIQKNLFNSSFFNFLESNGYYKIMINTKKYRLTENLLCSIKNAIDEDIMDTIKDEVKEKTDQKCDHLNETRLKSTQKILEEDIEKCCPFVKIHCQSPSTFLKKDMNNVEYFSTILKNKKLTFDETELLKKMNLYHKFKKNEQNDSNNNNNIDDIIMKPFKVKSINQIIKEKKKSWQIINFLLQNIYSLSNFNQLRCFIYIFEGEDSLFLQYYPIQSSIKNNSDKVKVLADDVLEKDNFQFTQKFLAYNNSGSDFDLPTVNGQESNDQNTQLYEYKFGEECKIIKNNDSSQKNIKSDIICEIEQKSELKQATNENIDNLQLSGLFCEIKDKIPKIIANLSEFDLKKVLNQNNNLNFLIPYINSFSFNIKRYYGKITHHMIAFEYLRSFDSKKIFLKCFLTDQRYNMAQKINFLHKIEYNLKEQEIISICLTFFDKKFVYDGSLDQVHLLQMKEISDKLTLLKMNSTNRKLLDFYLIQIKEYTKLVGINSKIKNLKK